MSAPSRRPRGSIARSVLVRLDGDQARAIKTQEQASGMSAAALLLAAWAEKSGKVPPLQPAPTILPSITDATAMAWLRQVGGILGKVVRTKAWEECNPSPSEVLALLENTLLNIQTVLDAKMRGECTLPPMALRSEVGRAEI